MSRLIGYQVVGVPSLAQRNKETKKPALQAIMDAYTTWGKIDPSDRHAILVKLGLADDDDDTTSTTSTSMDDADNMSDVDTNTSKLPESTGDDDTTVIVDDPDDSEEILDA